MDNTRTHIIHLPGTRNIEVLADRKIPLDNIIKAFDEYGTITNIATKAHTMNLEKKWIIITYETIQQAENANNKMKPRTKEGSQGTDQKRPIEPTLNKGSVYYFPRENKRMKLDEQVPKLKSVVGYASTSMLLQKPGNHHDPRRLFCSLPWNEPEPKREDNFFNEFAKHGPLEYCYAVRDKYNKLSLGFIRYISPKDAAVAVQSTSSKYRTQYAEPRKRSRTDIREHPTELTTLHNLCGNAVDVATLDLHIATCARQLQLRGRNFSEEGRISPVIGDLIDLTVDNEITFE